MATKNHKEIPVAALVPGMLVVKLDISWLDSPFLTHTRRIQGAEDIYALKNAGVKTVVIDLDGSPAPAPAVDPAQHAAPARKSNKAPQPQREPANAATSLKQELAHAGLLRKRVKAAVLSLQQSFERQSPINTAELSGLIDDTFASLNRNNQALLTLVHLSRKSQKLAEHTFGCFCLTLNLAVVCGLDECERRQLALAALLHEAGWAQVPLSLMGKRSGYSAAERAQVERHVPIGLDLLAGSGLSPLCLRLIAEHHELLDGSGYPNGLERGDLHPLSQLLAVVDTYEEWVHELRDRPGMTPAAALSELYREAQRGRFDEFFVSSLVSLLGIYPVMSAVLLNTGERALVRETAHYASALQPVVEILYSPDGTPLEVPRLVNLSQCNSGPGRMIRQAFNPHDSRLDPLGRLCPELSQIA